MSRSRAATPRSPHSSRGAAFGDVDNDGDVDVLIMNMNEPPSLLQNTYAGGHGWIVIKLEGTASNRSAIGATVVVTVRRRAAGARGPEPVQLLLARRSPAALRTGRLQSKADRIEITWPSGRTETLTKRAGSPRRDHQGRLIAVAAAQRDGDLLANVAIASPFERHDQLRVSAPFDFSSPPETVLGRAWRAQPERVGAAGTALRASVVARRGRPGIAARAAPHSDCRAAARRRPGRRRSLRRC